MVCTLPRLRRSGSEYNDNGPTHPTLRSVEPIQETVETTWSLAVENAFAATDDLDLLAGLSYDQNEVDRAQEFNVGLFDYPTGGTDAIHVQGAAYWRYVARSVRRSMFSLAGSNGSLPTQSMPRARPSSLPAVQ